MPHLIFDSQSAFVTGRAMHHNNLVSQELVRCYHHQNISPWCLLKIDLQKAYDTVSWKFLHGVLVMYGFDPWFFDRLI